MDNNQTPQDQNPPVDDPSVSTEAQTPVPQEDLAVTSTGVDLTATPGVGGNDQPDETAEEDSHDNVATAAVKAADPTPGEEAAFNTAAHPDQRGGVTQNPADNPGNPTPLQTGGGTVVDIDSSGIGVQTNSDVIDNFPKNDQGQVVIGEDGKIEGLEDGDQPLPGNVSS